MGDKNLTLFQPEFNRYMKVESRPERLSGEAGGVISREVIERLGIVKWLTKRLLDPRDPDLITHPLPELLHTALLLLTQGWRDQDDADDLRNDPVMRISVSTRRGIAPLQSPDEDASADIHRKGQRRYSVRCIFLLAVFVLIPVQFNQPSATSRIIITANPAMVAMVT